MRRLTATAFLMMGIGAALAGCSADAGDAGAMGGAGAGAPSPGTTSPGDGGAGVPGTTPSPGTTGGGDGGTPSPGSPDAGTDGPGTPPGGGGATGYFHTAGAQILDDQNRVVRLTGLSWFGMETSSYAPHGLWTRSLASMLDQIKSLGYNMIRIPYTNQMLVAGAMPNGVDAQKNPDLQGLTPIQLLDKVIDGAAARGLRVVLDRHRPDASAQSPLWYTAQVSEQTWIDDWKMLATRYKGKPTVVGFDLHNEPHDTASWGDGNMATDWRLAAERAGSAVQGVNPNLLIIVEGVEKTPGQTYWWGGNLRNALASPVRLPVANRLVYSPHEYPASVFAQPWFSDPAYPNNLPAVWDAAWGSVAKSGTAPVWIGEFGTKDEQVVDQKWFRGLASYIQSNKLSFAYWCLNPDSGDTGGILKDDWQTVNDGKQAVLQPILAPAIPATP